MKRLAMTLIVMLLLAATITGCGDGSSALVGKWAYESGAKYNKPENLELLKDGTGVCDGTSINWKVVDKRFVLSASLAALTADYEISDSKLTLTYDDGTSTIFVKKK